MTGLQKEVFWIVFSYSSRGFGKHFYECMQKKGAAFIAKGRRFIGTVLANETEAALLGTVRTVRALKLNFFDQENLIERPLNQTRIFPVRQRFLAGLSINHP